MVTRGTAIFLFLVGLGPAPAAAATLRVPSEYATIQAGMDVAAFGDTVLVAPGVYDDYEVRIAITTYTAAVFMTDGVTLLSEAGPDQTTIRIDGSGVGSCEVIHAVGLPSDATVIDGFQITGSMASAAGLVGEVSGTVTVRNCLFVDLQTGQGVGAAIWAKDLSLVLESCEFRRCVATQQAGLKLIDVTLTATGCLFEECGPGTLLMRDAGPSGETRIEDSIFRNSIGVALVLQFNPATITGCVFDGNVSTTNVGGVGAGGDGSGGLVVNLYDSVFTHNIGVSGGAIIWTGLTGEIVGNTFFGNQGVFSGACRLFSDENLVFQRNILAGNSGAPAVSVGAGFPQPISGCNLFWDNPDGDAQRFIIQPTSILADPEFCDPEAGDFTVHDTSPCLPANSNGCDLIGALGQGCGSVAVDAASWARIKASYR
jgi:hypothetical protein